MSKFKNKWVYLCGECEKPITIDRNKTLQRCYTKECRGSNAYQLLLEGDIIKLQSKQEYLGYMAVRKEINRENIEIHKRFQLIDPQYVWEDGTTGQVVYGVNRWINAKWSLKWHKGMVFEPDFTIKKNNQMICVDPKGVAKNGQPNIIGKASFVLKCKLLKAVRGVECYVYSSGVYWAWRYDYKNLNIIGSKVADVIDYDVI